MSDYDENQAIEFIRKRLGTDISNKYDDDQILNVIDIIWDFYEDRGLLEIDSFDDSDDEIQLQELINHAQKILAKDKGSVIDAEDIGDIVIGEIEYENSIDDF